MKEKILRTVYQNKHKPTVYLVYDYLKENCVGYDNRQKGFEVAEQFGITDNKSFRAVIEEIRDSDILQKFICSEAGSNGGYWIPTKEEEAVDTLRHLRLRAMKILYTYSKAKRKLNLNNQYRLKLSEYEKEIFESVMKV